MRWSFLLYIVLSKRYAKEVILSLDKWGELHFTPIQKQLNIHKSTLSKLLSYLESIGLVEKRVDNINVKKRGIPRTYFKLTPKGKKIAKLLKKIDELERELELSNNSVVISGNVSGENIIIGNNNSTIHIKKQ